MKEHKQKLSLESLSDTLDEFIVFVKDNMVVKDDLKNFATKDDLKNFATKDDIEELRLEMQAGFREIHGELDEIKASLARLEQKTQEDSDVAIQKILGLKKRVALLEQELGEMKSKHREPA